MKRSYIYIGHIAYKCYTYTKYLEYMQNIYSLCKIFKVYTKVEFFVTVLKDEKKEVMTS